MTSDWRKISRGWSWSRKARKEQELGSISNTKLDEATALKWALLEIKTSMKLYCNDAYCYMEKLMPVARSCPLVGKQIQWYSFTLNIITHIILLMCLDSIDHCFYCVFRQLNYILPGEHRGKFQAHRGDWVLLRYKFEGTLVAWHVCWLYFWYSCKLILGEDVIDRTLH